MKGLLFCIIMFLVMTACNSDQPPLNLSELLSRDNLESTFFNISPAQDTLLKGKKGVEIYIPKGSFVDESGEPPKGEVKIELKEATSKADFIIANLTTITKDGQVLESNGMAYINATADGKSLELKDGADVQVAFTNVPYIEGMEVYYGTPDPKGQMTWEKENQLVETDRVKAIKQGGKLYNENCTSCHSSSLRTEMTGPVLGNVHLFRDKDWFVKHVRNSQKMLEEGDPLSICLFDTWNKSVMSSFEHLTEEEVESIYWWLKNESEAQEIQLTEVNYIERCDGDTSIVWSDGTSTRIQKQEVSSRQEMVNVLRLNKLGWVNIDKDFDRKPTVKELLVETNKENASVSIILRWNNVFIMADYKNKDGLHTFTNAEKTPFPMLEEAILIAISKEGDDYYLGAKPIKLGDKLVEKINLEKKSRKQLLEEIRGLN